MSTSKSEIKSKKRKKFTSNKKDVEEEKTPYSLQRKNKSIVDNNSNIENNYNNNNNQPHYPSICDEFKLHQHPESDNVANYDAEGEWEEKKYKLLL